MIRFNFEMPEQMESINGYGNWITTERAICKIRYPISTHLG